ncbi:hypothetical protein D3C86_1842750 [compost metagenome]
MPSRECLDADDLQRPCIKLGLEIRDDLIVLQCRQELVRHRFAKHRSHTQFVGKDLEAVAPAFFSFVEGNVRIDEKFARLLHRCRLAGYSSAAADTALVAADFYRPGKRPDDCLRKFARSTFDARAAGGDDEFVTAYA